MTNHPTPPQAAAALRTKEEPKQPPAKKKSDTKTSKVDAPKAPRPNPGVAPGITG